MWVLHVSLPDHDWDLSIPLKATTSASYTLGEFTVGRLGTRIELNHPQLKSLSRHHGTFHVTQHTTEVPQTVFYTDNKSSFGSKLNGIELAPKIKTPLSSESLLVLGDRLHCRIEHIRFEMSGSCLSGESKMLLIACERGIGLIRRPNWSPNCTHLVMESIKATPKLIQALASASHIVGPQFLSKLLDSDDFDFPLNASDFLPDVADRGIHFDVDYSPNPARQTLFSGKTFLFLTPTQLKKIGPLVTAGGGTVVLYHNSETATASGANHMDLDSVTIHVASAMRKDADVSWFKQVTKQLKRYLRSSIHSLHAVDAWTHAVLGSVNPIVYVLLFGALVFCVLLLFRCLSRMERRRVSWIDCILLTILILILLICF
eukprot:m.118143 g.118143  ORF g.118143 m.118143 type:complete len:374 (+) comp13644_c0_seq3:106-1227(+)